MSTSGDTLLRNDGPKPCRPSNGEGVSNQNTSRECVRANAVTPQLRPEAVANRDPMAGTWMVKRTCLMLIVRNGANCSQKGNVSDAKKPVVHGEITRSWTPCVLWPYHPVLSTSLDSSVRWGRGVTGMTHRLGPWYSTQRTATTGTPRPLRGGRTSCVPKRGRMTRLGWTLTG